jgi:hypothetical protein
LPTLVLIYQVFVSPIARQRRVAKPKLAEGGRKVKPCATRSRKPWKRLKFPKAPGHKRASLTYGHYSKGERVKLRKAIEKLKYAPEVMRLIEGRVPQPQGSRRTQRRRKRS